MRGSVEVCRIDQRLEHVEEPVCGIVRGPGLPRQIASRRCEWIGIEGLHLDPERVRQFFLQPSGDVDRLRGGGEPIGVFVGSMALCRPIRQAVARRQGGAEPLDQVVVVCPKVRLERGDRIEAEHALIGVMQQLAERLASVERVVERVSLAERQDEQAVLCD